jgi:hypothetical protein
MWKFGLRPRNSQKKKKEYINGIFVAVQINVAFFVGAFPLGFSGALWLFTVTVLFLGFFLF